MRLTRFAESGADRSVEIKGQRSRKTSLVATVKNVKGFENRLQRHFFREFEYLRGAHVEGKKCVVEPQRVAFNQIRKCAAIDCRGRLRGTILNNRRNRDVIRQLESSERIEPMTLVAVGIVVFRIEIARVGVAETERVAFVVVS